MNSKSSSSDISPARQVEESAGWRESALPAVSLFPAVSDSAAALLLLCSMSKVSAGGEISIENTN